MVNEKVADEGSLMKSKQKQQILPEELWLLIFTYLDPVDLAKAAQTCNQWSQLICHSETLWRAQCLSISELETKQQIMSDKSSLDKGWKKVFQDNYGHQQIKRYWLAGKFSNITCVEELPYRVMCPMDQETWGDILDGELNSSADGSERLESKQTSGAVI